MKFTSVIKQFKQSITRKSLVIAALVAAVTAGSFGAAIAEFYPDRPVYDYNTAEGRIGSMNGPVFNSFVNTPSYGDERSFVDARRSDQTAAGSFKNVLPDVTEGSREVVIRTYIHNNANQSTNESGLGIAKNTKVRVDLPEATGNVMRARGYITADNATTVEDTVDFTAAQNFSMEYVPGSATLFNNGPFQNGTSLSDAIVDSGALIGYDALNGNFPGCFDYEAVVQIRVKITPKSVPGMDMIKEVRIKGQTEWKKEVSAKAGENVEWLITTDNTGSAKLDNIVVRDVLPPHVQLVPGSVKRINSNDTSVQGDAPLFDGGINVGSYNGGAGFYIMFETKTLGDFSQCEVRVRNQAFTRSTQTPEIGDTADLTIKKENCNVVTPTYSCTNLSVSKSSVKPGEKFTVSVPYTASNGATFKLATITFGDEKTDKDKLVTNTSTGNVVTAEHSYATVGTYTISAKLDFTIDGKTKSLDGGNCVARITVTETPVTPAPQVKPAQLVNTGPGSTIAIFGTTSFIGALLYRAKLLRSVR